LASLGTVEVRKLESQVVLLFWYEGEQLAMRARQVSADAGVVKDVQLVRLDTLVGSEDPRTWPVLANGLADL